MVVPRAGVGDAVSPGTAQEMQPSSIRSLSDFVSLLPLTLALEDYASTEKISDLPKRLSTEDAPSDSDPSVGDIAFYAPWGNLAIFYRDAKYTNGLIILGKIDGDAEPFDVRFAEGDN